MANDLCQWEDGEGDVFYPSQTCILTGTGLRKGYRGKDGEGGGSNVFRVSSVSTRVEPGIQLVYYIKLGSR